MRCIHQVIKDSYHFFGCFLEAPSDPFIQHAEKGIGIEPRLIALLGIRTVLRHHHLIESVINGRLHIRLIHNLQDMPDLIIKLKKILCIVKRKPVPHGNCPFVCPTVPEPDELKSEGFALVL